MNVLLAVFDLFSKAGGGESFFQRLIKSNPADRYWVLDTGEGAAPVGRLNVELVRVDDFHRRLIRDRGVRMPDGLPAGLDLSNAGERIGQLLDIAAALQGLSFDIIEIPDYLVYGWLLIPILKRYGVRWGKVVLSMHGTISNSLGDNWAGAAVGDLSMFEATESLLFRSCDIRYGFGRPYVEAWHRTERLPVHLLDPLHVLDLGSMSLGRLYEPAGNWRAPDLAFVGRQDRGKGPDLFIDLAARLPREAYGYLHFYGPSTEGYGVNSLDMLAQNAEHRGLKYHTNRPVRHVALMRTLATDPIITVLPSRLDTFNLAALESLLNGCPTALSSRCGAADFLSRAMPGLEHFTFDVSEIDEAARGVGQMLGEYDALRARLREQLERLAPISTGLSIGEIHEADPTPDPDARALAERVADRLLISLDDVSDIQLLAVRGELRRDFSEVKAQNGYSPSEEALDAAVTSAVETRRVRGGLKLDSIPPPKEADLLSASGDAIPRLAARIGAADRAPTLDLLAELERVRGNPAVFAAYTARYMRMTGCTEPARLDDLAEALSSIGMVEEARVARMCFTSGQPGLYDYLQDRLDRPPGPPEEGIVARLDHRSSAIPRVTVVVSLYNGARKLPRFLRMLASQDPAARELMEVVLIDSNSEDDTQEMAARLLESDYDGAGRLSALYVRTRERETIQKAWNRGVVEARGDVLTFLGNDEAMHPSTLLKFLDVLDSNPSIDWVQGDALITEVSELGEYVRDVSLHRRSLDTHEAQYLECCYLGFAGAAYRRSLHDRFGFYDPTFRAAGDNEWKNRILHRIKVQTLPETLGFFLNYPEVRTTESPVAELEDIRAWYAFRTPEGVRYSFDGRGDDACIRQLHRALGYRRPYSTEVSTDLEYAAAMGEYLRSRRPEAYRKVAPLSLAAAMVLEGYRAIDDISLGERGPGIWRLERDLNAAKRAGRLVAEGADLLRRRGREVPYWYRNDNRSQQHCFAWPSVQRRFDPGTPIAVPDVAGAYNLAGLLAASGAASPLVDLTTEPGDSARLTELEPLHGWMPCTEEVEAEGMLDVLLSTCAAEFELLVTGAVSIAPLPGSRARAVGPVRSERPLTAGVRVALMPAFQLVAGRSLLRRTIDCLWRGVPLVLGAGVAEAIRGLSPGLELGDIAVVDSPQSLAEHFLALLPEGSRRDLALKANAALAARLFDAGIVTRSFPESLENPFNADVRETGWLARQCAEGRARATNGLQSLLSRRADPGFRARADAVVAALLVDRSAALLQREDVFPELAGLPDVADLTAAYARLYLLGARKSNPAAAALVAALRLQRRAPWAQSDIGAWRLGAVVAPPAEGAVVVLAARRFWSSSEGTAVLTQLPHGTKVGSLDREPEDSVVLGAAQLDRALADARLTVLIAPTGAAEGDGFDLWAKALASGAAVMGTRDALWFATSSDSPAIFRTIEEVIRALPEASHGPGLAKLRAERIRLLERLGVAPWRLVSARAAT